MNPRHEELQRIVSIADADTAAIFPEATRAALARTHALAATISTRFRTYGRTTGVGAERTTSVHRTDDSFGLRLLRSHALDAGPRVPDRTVRAMLAVRLRQLSVPGSGIDPSVPAKLAEMINSDALPRIHDLGTVGTGDLAALAGTALTMVGEREATRSMEPLEAIGADSALPLMSSSALTLARCILALDQIERLTNSGAVIYAFSFIGLEGNEQAISRLAARAAAAPRVASVSRRIRALLAGCRYPLNSRIQDPFGLRMYPLSEAALRTRIDALGDQAVRAITTAQENPLFDGSAGEVIHHGGPFLAELGLLVDSATLALVQTAPLVLSRIRMINDPAFNGGRAFLGDGPPGAVGVMMLEYVAASALGELRAAAQPASLGTVVLSRGTEEDASYASQGAIQLERAVRAYRSLLACELLASIRLIRQRGRESAIPTGLEEPFALLENLPAETWDRDLREDMEIAEELLDKIGPLAPPLD